LEIQNNALTAKQVWEYAYRNLTYYPEFNYSEMAHQVWNHENRTLTVYPNITQELSSIADSLQYINQTILSSYGDLSNKLDNIYNEIYILNNTINQMNSTLYLVNETIMNQLMNLNVSFNYTEMSKYVWNYENRTLTEFNFSNSELYAVNQSLFDYLNFSFGNTNQIIYALDNNMANNFTKVMSDLYSFNSSIEYYIYNSTNNLTAYIQNITIITAKDVWTYEVRELTTAVNVSAGNISNVANALATFTDLRYVGATEYNSGEVVQSSYQFLTTLSGSPEPITNGNCLLTVWYPNKTKMVDNQPMSHL
jgi:hypothetical protein